MIGNQLHNILIKKSDFTQIAVDTAESIAKQMKENTDAGRGFGADEYVNNYSLPYARRKKQGSISPVTLRGDRREIENTVVHKQTNSGTIKFNDSDAGRIFNYHHRGIAKGGKTRSVFPKTPQSVPDSVRSEIRQKVREALSGS
jgi:CO/xanthine dehydrogenase Mo-binding subunit